MSLTALGISSLGLLDRCKNKTEYVASLGLIRVCDDVINNTSSFTRRAHWNGDGVNRTQRRIKQDDNDLLEIISVLFKIGKL